MADRDAFIVICWLAILALMFFECFYRKLKSRLSRDVQPPHRFSSSTTSASTRERQSCEVVELSSELTRRHDRNNNRGGCGGGGRFLGPISITKEMCRIPMEIGYGDDEEPPPSYEEALSYAKLVTKFQFSPYGDTNIPECEVSDQSDDRSVVCSTSKKVIITDRHRSSGSSSVDGCCSSAKCDVTVTTAAFPITHENANSDEEGDVEEEEEEEDTDQSSDSLTDVESENETMISEQFIDRNIPETERKVNEEHKEPDTVTARTSLSISINLENFEREEKNDVLNQNMRPSLPAKSKGSTKELSTEIV